MTLEDNITLIDKLGSLLLKKNGTLLHKAVEMLCNALMKLEVKTIIETSKFKYSKNYKHIEMVTMRLLSQTVPWTLNILIYILILSSRKSKKVEMQS